MEGYSGSLGEILERIRIIDPALLKVLLHYTILALLGINLFLFVFTVIHRLWTDFRESRYRRAYEKYTEQVVNSLFGEAQVEPPKGAIEREALGDVCVEIRRKFKGEVAEKVTQIARSTGVVDMYFSQTRSRFVFVRLTAYEKLAYLRIREAKEPLKEAILTEKDDYAVARLCFAYSMLVESPEEIPFLFERISSLRSVSFKFLEFIWFNLLTAFEEMHRLDELIAFLEDYAKKTEDLMTLRSLVEAIGSKSLLQAHRVVERIYERFKEDPSVRISCVRAFGLMGYPGFCDIFPENVNYKDWRVRAIACRFAYLCPYEKVVEFLKERLSDRSYYVRINAGRAILFFKERARELLEELLSSEDRFVRDTAKYLLRELEVRGA